MCARAIYNNSGSLYSKLIAISTAENLQMRNAHACLILFHHRKNLYFSQRRIIQINLIGVTEKERETEGGKRKKNTKVLKILLITEKPEDNNNIELHKVSHSHRIEQSGDGLIGWLSERILEEQRYHIHTHTHKESKGPQYQVLSEQHPISSDICGKINAFV